MKKYILSLLITIPVLLCAATADELIQQAKVKYAAGNHVEAIAILDEVLSKDSGNMQAKKILADICVDTGEREYDNKNYKNAFNYFKKAVKLLPTHPIATERYWKMKNDFDVNNLRNEGGEISTKSADTIDTTSGDKGTSSRATGKETKKSASEKEINASRADEIYSKRVIEMEERFNKRLIEMNARLKQSAEAEKSGIAGFLNSIASEPKLIITSIFLLILLVLLFIISANYLLKSVKKRIASWKGEKEYDKLFGSENAQNYNELIKMQNINELLNKIKSGELDWNTIRRSISEMDRELRLEVFSYIESKSEQYQQPLTMGQADILMSLMLDGDEYLRKRVAAFTSAQLARPAGSDVKALPYIQGGTALRQPLLQLPDQTTAYQEKTFLGDLNIVLPLSKIVDRKVFNDNHASKVGVDAYDMAGILGLDQDECNLYYIAGLLHDVGYLDIPSEILNKKSSLSEKEFAVIRTHTKRGADLLDFTEIPQVIKDGILYHHEKWAGEGYPEGLSGEDIPLVARVISIFDMYEALILPRPQRPPFPVKEAVRIIKKGSGNLFDPELVKIFDRMVKENLVSRSNIWKD